MDQLVYKIAPVALWSRALDAGVFAGSEHDARDGFIHFSTRAQLAGTLAKHFAAERDLVLLELDIRSFGGKLVWEPSRGGELFPHLYGTFHPGDVVRQWTLGPPGDAVLRLPEELRR